MNEDIGKDIRALPSARAGHEPSQQAVSAVPVTIANALKSCPFCGGNKVTTFGPYGWYHLWGISHSCKSFYNGAQEMFQGFHTEELAIKAWDTRAAPDCGMLQAAWDVVGTLPPIEFTETEVRQLVAALGAGSAV